MGSVGAGATPSPAADRTVGPEVDPAARGMEAAAPVAAVGNRVATRTDRAEARVVTVAAPVAVAGVGFAVTPATSVAASALIGTEGLARIGENAVLIRLVRSRGAGWPGEEPAS